MITGLVSRAFACSVFDLNLPGLRQPPKSSMMLGFWGFDLPGLQPPSMSLNNPRNRAQCSFSTSLGFDNPQQSLKSSVMLGFGGFQPRWASTSLRVPQQPPRSSVVLVFNLPGLQQPSATPEIEHDARFLGGFWGVFDLNLPPRPSTTPEIERDAWFWGFSTSLGFNLPRPPPKSSVMLGFGGFRPSWASTSLHDPQQPLKPSTMLGFGSF